MGEPTGVALLTIRAWCEDGSARPLRVEIRLAEDVAAGFGSSVTVIDTSAVMEAVRDFLDGLPCRSLEGPDVTPVSRSGAR